MTSSVVFPRHKESLFLAQAPNQPLIVIFSTCWLPGPATWRFGPDGGWVMVTACGAFPPVGGPGLAQAARPGRPLAKAEPKTLRYRLLHAAARLTRGARRRRLNIQATWPWAADIATAWERISALPQAP